MIRRVGSRAAAAVLGAVTAVVDGAGDRVRYGWGHAVRRRLLARRLVSVPSHHERPADAPRRRAADGSGAGGSRAVAVLVTRTLGTGGVESIVATLAERLPEHGVATLVVCERGGRTAERLRAAGVRVVEGTDAEDALDEVMRSGAFVVAQLHNAPEALIEACRRRGIPTVPVIHTTDVNLTPSAWAAQAALARVSAVTIAVSGIVRDYALHHAPSLGAERVVVIPNGVDPAVAVPDARALLARALDVDVRRDVVVVCLARYDIQKNVPALVSAFLEAAHERSRLRLVVAGPVEDWLEHAHADAIRRAHAAGDRVHLLGESSSAVLLAAADAFVLDSFFEGWPVAASEAVMAGIPVVLSDVGGARELVGSRGERGILCANPAGAPDTIGRDDIRRARRSTAHQQNRAELVGALLAVTDGIDRWRDQRATAAAAAVALLDADAMTRAHAAVLVDAALAPGVRR